MAQRLLFIHGLTPLHAGSGQGVGAIDLPIQRERATNLPLLPGSSIKGCLRDALAKDPLCDLLFGTKSKDGEDMTAGALRISDAHLLLLPVRCLGATFVWATCPFILRRLARLAQAGQAAAIPNVPALADSQARVSSSDPLVLFGNRRRLVLEDLDLDPGDAPDKSALEWCDWIALRLFPSASAEDTGWRAEMKKRFAILDDKSFDFFSEFATEVSAHIAIDDASGVVREHMLWYQEALPAESILCGIVQADAPRGNARLTDTDVLDRIGIRSDLQFGGKASTGLGLVRLVPARA